MTEEKQIEEMANDLAQHCPDLVENCCGASSCVSCITRFLYNAGYRKASELLEEIERVAMSKIDANLSIATLDDTYYIEAIDELKKKYEREGAE